MITPGLISLNEKERCWTLTENKKKGKMLACILQSINIVDFASGFL